MAVKKKVVKKATKKATAKATKKVAKKATKKVAAKATTKKVAKVATKKVAAKATKKKATAKVAKVAKKRAPNPAFMRPLQPSAALALVVGEKALPRTEVVKKVWDYIKKNKLQNPKNMRNIFADDKLLPIFGKKEVTMFEMTKLVSGHLA